MCRDLAVLPYYPTSTFILCKVIEGDLKMKKLIALALMVVCVAGFSLGCKGKKDPAPTSTTPEATAPAEGADATPAETPAE